MAWIRTSIGTLLVIPPSSSHVFSSSSCTSYHVRHCLCLAELTRNPNQGRAVVSRPSRGGVAGPGARNAGPNPTRLRPKPMPAGPPTVGSSRPT
jgi:hypothetical protein